MVNCSKRNGQQVHGWGILSSSEFMRLMIACNDGLQPDAFKTLGSKHIAALRQHRKSALSWERCQMSYGG